MAITEEKTRNRGSGRCGWNKEETGKRVRTCCQAAVLLAAVLLAAVPSAAADTASGATNPTVIVADYTVTPAVLLPGDQGMVTLTIENTALSASLKENSGVTLGGSFASMKSTDINAFIERVSLEGNGVTVMTGAFDRIGELGPGQSVPLTFVIRAPSRDGIYFPEVWIDVKDGRSTRYPVMVNVNTDISTLKKPALSVSQEFPARVAPGEDCAGTLRITNSGLARASDIAFLINSTTKSLVLVTSGKYYRDHLDPGETENLSIRFATDKETPPGIEPATLTITYSNPDGRTERQVETLGIPVRGRAEIAVSSVSTDPVRPIPGNPFTLIVRVENTGTDQAASVRAAIDSPFTGTKTAFIGSIDKDSDAPAIFYLQDTEEGTIPVNLTIHYTDDFGSHVITEQAVIVTTPGSGMLPAAVAILVVAGIAGTGYWYFRIRPGKRHGE